MKWLDGITDLEGMNLSKLYEIVKDRKAWHSVVHGVTKSWTWLSDWTELRKPREKNRKDFTCVFIIQQIFAQCHILGVSNLWGLMSDDLRWSWCNNNRNKVHNKCNVLESSPNHTPSNTTPLPHTPSMEKLSSVKPVRGAKKFGDCWFILFPFCRWRN